MYLNEQKFTSKKNSGTFFQKHQPLPTHFPCLYSSVLLQCARNDIKVKMLASPFSNIVSRETAISDTLPRNSSKTTNWKALEISKEFLVSTLFRTPGLFAARLFITLYCFILSGNRSSYSKISAVGTSKRNISFCKQFIAENKPPFREYCFFRNIVPSQSDNVSSGLKYCFLF